MFSRIIKMRKHATLVSVFCAPLLRAGFCIRPDYLPTSAYLFLDSKKNLWIAANYAIYLLGNDGVIRQVNEAGGNSVFEDQSGKVWVDSGGNDIGIRVYEYQNPGSTLTLINTYTRQDGLFKSGFSNAIAQTSDGKIFVASDGKLSEFVPGAKNNELKFRSFEINSVSSAINKDGTIWLSIPGKGAARYLPNSFYTFDEKEGLPNEPIRGIFGNKNGEVFFTVGNQKLARFDNGKIETVKIPGVNTRSWVDGILDL